MTSLTENNWMKAREFMEHRARPLEKSLFAYHFSGGDAGDVLSELTCYQNEDGGFGNALEPDFRIPASSVLATTVALQTLWELEIGSDNALVQGAMRYLVSTYDNEHDAWPFIPAFDEQVAHAPWWQYNPDLTLYLDNPRPEIARYYLDYADLTPDGQARALYETVSQRVASLDELEFHALFCYLRLLDSRALDDADRQQLSATLEPLVLKNVVADSAEWSAYTLKPLSVVTAPDSPFAHLFPDAIEENLEFEIASQGDDGAWSPPWSWAESFPEIWPQARQDWQGVLTLNTLKTLSNFGRLPASV